MGDGILNKVAMVVLIEKRKEVERISFIDFYLYLFIYEHNDNDWLGLENIMGSKTELCLR